MELLIFLQRKSSCSSLCFLLLLLPLVFSFSGISVVEGYKNYTVGDSSGWYAAVNYQKWADAKTFSLGDFLIFNTDTNHSVVQTYNLTTYKLCDYNDALENDTMQWSAADPSNMAIHDVSVAVPLVREGMNYFFSGDYDGEQCKNGQHFKITVSHGQGLPKSLQNPAVQSPSPASGPGRQSAGDGDNDDGSVPDTIVPASFDHPKEDDTATGDHDKDSSGSLCVKHKHGLLFRVFIFLGFLYCCLW
ncbi:hypothetical protein ACFX15_029647 [Malus domestica]|uniref:early nodulin-like protein 18 n=1 Tax=Malus domestica TaxID=3750 RepID=UPI0010AAE5C4|nr:blue copper protein [Malus domestica]XP_050137820.1 blue copper protein [Malus sylvestris]